MKTMMRSPSNRRRGGRFRLVLAAVPLLMAAACGGNVEEVSGVVLARHVHTDLYDAYPGIPSPAGDRVVFADYAADKRSLTVYDVATGVGRAVTRTPGGRTRVTWSPDGSRIVYVDRQSDRHGVWTLDPATGRESRIVDPGDARIDYPRLLPDGTVTALRYAGADTAWVAYAPGVDRAISVSASVVVDRAGGWVAPVRSPDGRSVAYLRSAGRRAALAVTEIATGETRTLAADLRLGWDRRVEWSSAGGALHLAAAGIADSLFVAWRVPLDGSPAERLGHDGRDVLAVTPLADGRVALSVYHTRTAVGLVPATGGEPTAVTAGGAASAFLPSWHPDGRALGFITFSWRRVRMPIDFDLG
ncbi:MAG: hypothetical protein F4037_06830, partial [Gemmatimonadales bacterium]|nr:hypothetical protein [Candidatus Palauibacter ramosifaciens]